MSKCPYGRQMEKQLGDVVDAFGANLDLDVFYIGKTTPEGGFKTLYGEADVAGDLYQVCAQSRTPDWYHVIQCQNDDIDHLATNWPACAAQNGVPSPVIAAVNACAMGDEGKRLLTASFEHSEKLGIKGSPALRIADEPYEGPRSVMAYTRSICAHWSATKPDTCAGLPVPQPVAITILNDKRCTRCDAAHVPSTLKQRILDPVISNLDYGDPEGKALFALVGPTKLPAIVFDRSLEADPDALGAFRTQAKQIADHYVVTSGSWNPACADTGGCSLAECADTLFCHAEVSKKFDLYMMGRCPFAAKGIIALKSVLADFQKHNTRLDLTVHYIGTTKPDGHFESMRGKGEVEEDLRQVCVTQHYPQNLHYLDYMACRSADLKHDDWESCVGGKTGFDAGTIRKCAEGAEGKSLLEKSFASSDRVGIKASPTWVTKNKFEFEGIDAESIKKGICAHENLPGCVP